MFYFNKYWWKTSYIKNGLLTTIALDYQNKITYALEGSIFVAGAAIQWLRDQIKIVYHASETDWYTNLVQGDQQVYVVPSFTGLGSPYWDSYSRGAIFELERGTKREHLVKATTCLSIIWCHYCHGWRFTTAN